MSDKTSAQTVQLPQNTAVVVNSQDIQALITDLKRFQIACNEDVEKILAASKPLDGDEGGIALSGGIGDDIKEAIIELRLKVQAVQESVATTSDELVEFLIKARNIASNKNVQSDVEEIRVRRLKPKQ